MCIEQKAYKLSLEPMLNVGTMHSSLWFAHPAQVYVTANFCHATRGHLVNNMLMLAAVVSPSRIDAGAAHVRIQPDLNLVLCAPSPGHVANATGPTPRGRARAAPACAALHRLGRRRVDRQQNVVKIPDGRGCMGGGGKVPAGMRSLAGDVCVRNPRSHLFRYLFGGPAPGWPPPPAPPSSTCHPHVLPCE